MAWTTPSTWVSGAILTAAQLNTQLRDNMNAIRSPQINVQSTLKQDTFTSNSTSYVDVTGLSVSITPSSATSKVLVIVSLAILPTANGYSCRGALIRGSTQIGGGTAAGSRPSGSFYGYTNDSRAQQPVSFTMLDSPATTSATTYKVQVAVESGGTVAINRSDVSDSDNAALPRLASSITVMEIPV